MEVQKPKQKDIEKISDYYITRRTIDTTEPQYLKIKSVVLTENSKIAVQSTIGGEDIVIIIGEYTNEIIDLQTQMDINYFFNNIMSSDCIYNKKDIEGSEFKAYLSDDLTELGLKQNELLYDVKLSKNVNTIDIKENTFKNICAWNDYTKAKINNVPWVHEISHIKPKGKDKFDLTVTIFDNYEISWELEVPFQTDIKKDPLAKLIENEGYGDLQNLDEEGEVVILHKSDINDNIEIIGYDKTNQWALITKKEFKYTKYNSIPTIMETLDYCGNTILMSIVTIIMGSHLIGIMQMSGFEHLYIPTAIVFLMSLTMTYFLLNLSTKLPREKFKDYLNIN